MKAFLHKYKHASLFLYLLIYFPWFFWLEKTATRYYVIEISIDRMIPFMEIFVIPYLLWFVYIAAACLYFFFKAPRKEYYRLGAFLISGMTLFLIISTIFPNGQALRPFMYERDNIFVTMVQMFYKADTPTNVFPSMHVYNTIVVHIAICNNEYLRSRKWIIRSSGILAILIILSTVFLKQHSVIDGIGAGLLAYLIYAVVYKLEPAMELRRLRQKRGISAPRYR